MSLFKNTVCPPFRTEGGFSSVRLIILKPRPGRAVFVEGRHRSAPELRVPDSEPELAVAVLPGKFVHAKRPSAALIKNPVHQRVPYHPGRFRLVAGTDPTIPVVVLISRSRREIRCEKYAARSGIAHKGIKRSFDLPLAGVAPDRSGQKEVKASGED